MAQYTTALTTISNLDHNQSQCVNSNGMHHRWSPSVRFRVQLRIAIQGQPTRIFNLLQIQSMLLVNYEISCVLVLEPNTSF